MYSDTSFTMAIEYSGDNAIYVGKSAPGTPKGSAKWQIKKIAYTGSNPTDIQFAGGSSKFDYEWDERASYTYS